MQREGASRDDNGLVQIGLDLDCKSVLSVIGPDTIGKWQNAICSCTERVIGKQSVDLEISRGQK